MAVTREAWAAERLEHLGLPWPGLPPRPRRAAVGLDGGARSLDAVVWAGRLAEEVHAAVALGPDAPESGPMRRAEAADWGAPTESAVAQAWPDLLDRLGEQRLIAHRMQAPPVDAILATAEDAACDLVLAGARNEGWLDRALFGSVTESLLHHAPVTTLLAEDAPGHGPVVAAVGRDKGSPLAAAWATAVAAWLELDLVLAHATPDAELVPGFADAGDQGEALLVGWPPSKTIAALAEQREACLVVAGHGPVPGWLGSTAVSLARASPASLLIARAWSTENAPR